jgi:hypothetical protein
MALLYLVLTLFIKTSGLGQANHRLSGMTNLLANATKHTKLKKPPVLRATDGFS